MPSPYTLRFQVGKTYRLYTSSDFNRLRGGILVVKAELKAADTWGNRILLVDAYLSPKGDPNGPKEPFLGSRCFVEEGYAPFMDSFGSRTIPSEVATLQGVYPDLAKAYALDEEAISPKQYKVA